MSTISIHELEKRYGDVVAVQDLDLVIPEGQMFFLLGPSGSGKTTTLRCVAGLETPDSGIIRIGHRDVVDLEPGERDVGMIFQTFSLFPTMSAYQNVAFPLRMMKVRKEEVRERVEAISDYLHLSDLLKRDIGQLSDAARQRVSLARAIVRQPSVLLMDEPLTFLDAKLRIALGAELKALQTDLALTSLYVTHDQLEAMTMGDRIAIMNEGTIHQLGTPDEVYGRPATRFVASFVGSPGMTFLPGAKTPDGISVPGLSYSLPLEPMSPGDVEIGFRPEACRLGGEPSAGSLKVEFVEWMGSEVFVHGRVGEHKIIATTEPGSDPQRGERVPFSLDPTQVHVFDRVTERRLDVVKRMAS